MIHAPSSGRTMSPENKRPGNSYSQSVIETRCRNYRVKSKICGGIMNQNTNSAPHCSIEFAFQATHFRHKTYRLTEEEDMGLTRSINVLVVGAAFVFVVTMLFI